jgi:hypothetical protein
VRAVGNEGFRLDGDLPFQCRTGSGPCVWQAGCNGALGTRTVRLRGGRLPSATRLNSVHGHGSQVQASAEEPAAVSRLSPATAPA